jgi:glycosyltransferase involved in cell wall biosynthesis
MLVGYGIPTPPEYNSTFSDSFEISCPEVKGKRFILFISRIAFKKGVDLLIDSYDHLSKQNTDLPYLIIAGPKDSDYAINMILKAKMKDLKTNKF